MFAIYGLLCNPQGQDSVIYVFLKNTLKVAFLFRVCVTNMNIWVYFLNIWHFQLYIIYVAISVGNGPCWQIRFQRISVFGVCVHQ